MQNRMQSYLVIFIYLFFFEKNNFQHSINIFFSFLSKKNTFTNKLNLIN